ncbi:MAG: tripartite tricarboxylate transporter substrate binding protein [Betaproteobacteria bacterium]|jgi:tripartite-type tricarboxylate transporter receptor subunit TctC
MKKTISFIASLCSVFLLFNISVSSAADNSYPNRPIRVIVPFPPGGPTDNYARLIASKMQEDFKQPVVVENRAGGTGTPGTLAVMNAPADGYTLIFTSNSAHLIGPLLKNPVPYDSVKDFTPLTMAIKYPMYLLVNPNLPVKTIPEFIQYAKSKSNQLNYSSVGIGSGGHLACELFNIAAGTNIVHVPYKGAAPAQAALIGGETQMFCDSVGNSQGMVNAGKMRGLALFSDKRSTVVPEVPTMGEMGLQGLAAYIWLGMLAPPNLPLDIQNKLNTELVKIMAMPDVAGFALKGGNDIVANTPAQFGQMMRDEKEIWLKVIREKNIKAE